VINKTAAALAAPVGLANFRAAGTARVYQYSKANLGAIVRQPDVTLTAEGIPGVFPAYSLTLYEIPADASQFAAPEPVVSAVVNAASYVAGLAPGEMVTVFGARLGPAVLQPLGLDANGLIEPTVAGVRILFDGVAAPLIYVSATQAAAIVPYFTANLTTVHVEVENQGHRSAAFEAPVVAAAPGIFSVNEQGSGQGAVLNSDGRTLNSSSHPAPAGSVVSLFVTGLGQTSPPGFDGKRAGPILPAPVLPVSVSVGGAAAEIEYAGAAPGLAGMSQINVRIPASTAAGAAVPVVVKAGAGASSNSVTIAVSAP
jgi:uncharacterized protein (TIGR03437 family)